jgi:hypothetical protein
MVGPGLLRYFRARSFLMLVAVEAVAVKAQAVSVKMVEEIKAFLDQTTLVEVAEAVEVCLPF